MKEYQIYKIYRYILSHTICYFKAWQTFQIQAFTFKIFITWLKLLRAYIRSALEIISSFKVMAFRDTGFIWQLAAAVRQENILFGREHKLLHTCCTLGSHQGHTRSASTYSNPHFLRCSFCLISSWNLEVFHHSVF